MCHRISSLPGWWHTETNGENSNFFLDTKGQEMKGSSMPEPMFPVTKIMIQHSLTKFPR